MWEDWESCKWGSGDHGQVVGSWSQMETGYWVSRSSLLNCQHFLWPHHEGSCGWPLWCWPPSCCGHHGPREQPMKWVDSLNKSPETPSATISEQSCWFVPDPPHLKNLQNNFMTKDIQFTAGGQTYVVKWAHVHHLWALDCSNATRLVPKWNQFKIISLCPEGRRWYAWLPTSSPTPLQLQCRHVLEKAWWLGMLKVHLCSSNY